MLELLKKLTLGAPVVILIGVLFAGLKIVQSDPAEKQKQPRVTPQAVVIEAKSDPIDRSAPEATPPVQADSNQADSNKDEVWTEINDAISGLNDLVGAEMFIDVKRTQKGQLEVLLDRQYWDRVNYVTRVDLKTDISNLWHLYVKEYSGFESSVVYFIDDSNGKVIDIFSRSY